MAREFKLPDLGEGIHEGEIVEIFVKPGDAIKEGDPLLEVETDKAVTAIPSPFTATVGDVRVKPGDLVLVGDVLVVFEGDAAEVRPTRPVAAEDQPPPEPLPDEDVPAHHDFPIEKAVKPGRRSQPPVPASPVRRCKWS